MKNISIFILGMLFVVSCERQETINLETTNTTMLVAKYLVLNNNQYELKLSETDAIALGVAASEYNKILDEISFTNKEIEKHIADSDSIFTLTDPQAKEKNIEIELHIARLKTRVETDELKGTITTTGQEVGSGGGWAPLGTKEVVFDCISFGAILPIYNLTTTTQGEVKSGGGVGVIGKNSTFIVPIAASNTALGVTFRTSDNNGGKCVWKCQ